MMRMVSDGMSPLSRVVTLGLRLAIPEGCCEKLRQVSTGAARGAVQGSDYGPVRELSSSMALVMRSLAVRPYTAGLFSASNIRAYSSSSRGLLTSMLAVGVSKAGLPA
jgi:hypothetical protein